MVCFKDWLYLEKFDNFYKSCVGSVLLERTCTETIKLIFENIENEDEEPYVANIDDEKFPDDSGKPIEDFSQDEPSTPPEELKKEISQSILAKRKELHDAILILRWNAISQRSKEIEEIRKIKDEYIKSQNLSENIEEDDEDDEFSSYEKRLASKKSFDFTKAATLLKKLGYIDIDELREQGLDEKEIEKEIIKSLFKASEEENELPVGVEKVINPEEVRKATEKFFLLTREIFKRGFRSIARKQTSYVQGETGSKLGGYLFDPGYFDNQIIDDISNRFSLHMLELFTKRKVEDGKVKPWLRLRNHKDFGKEIDQIESSNQKFVDAIINYMASTLSGFQSKEDRAAKLANQPSGPSQDLEVWGGNRDKKKNLINRDLGIEKKRTGSDDDGDEESDDEESYNLSKQNLDFYKNYMSASPLEREKLDERFFELERKVDQRIKLSKEEHEEKWRFEIIRHIFFLESKHKGSLSLSPKDEDIVKTLTFYKDNFLGHRYRSQSFFGVMGKKTDSGPGSDARDSFDVLGLGTDATSKLGDSGGSRDRTPGSFPNPTGEAGDNELRQVIQKHLIDCFREMSLQRGGREWSLAICVFWNLGNCSLSGNIDNVSNFSNLVLNITKSGNLKAADKTGCRDQLLNHLRSSGVGGIRDIDRTVEELSAITGKTENAGTVRNWIDKGLNFICQYMKEKLGGTSLGATASTAPTRKFDASRPSPLAGRLSKISTQQQQQRYSPGDPRSWRSPSVVTDPDTGEKKLEFKIN